MRAGLEAKAYLAGYSDAEPRSRLNALSLAPIQLKWMPQSVGRPFQQNTSDRPIGLQRNASNLNQAAVGEWWDWEIVVTREAI